MAHRVVHAARRLTQALRSISKSQCATAVAEFSSTFFPRHRRLSAVRADTGEPVRVLGWRPRTQVSGPQGGVSAGFAVARRQGPIRGSRTRKRSGRNRISRRIRSASTTWPALSSAIASMRRGKRRSGGTIQDLPRKVCYGLHGRPQVAGNGVGLARFVSRIGAR